MKARHRLVFGLLRTIELAEKFKPWSEIQDRAKIGPNRCEVLPLLVVRKKKNSISLVVFRLIKLQSTNQGQAYGASSDAVHIKKYIFTLI